MTFHIKLDGTGRRGDGRRCAAVQERASDSDSRILLLEHTFRVENDLVLASDSFAVNDVSEPRTGPSPTAPAFERTTVGLTGRVVYEGSDIAAPRDLGILVDVFDGEKTWSTVP